MRSLLTKLSIILLVIAALGFTKHSHATQGGQFEQSGRFQVHYMALSSTFLTPQIAKTYHIKRSRYNAFVNIAILDTLLDGNPAVNANVTGIAVNLTGNTRQLTFKEVIEGDAIYYIAELPFRNDEQFTIQVSSTNRDGLNSTINFRQKFYAE